jgi:thiamine-phosphate pyrophosphorylase
MLRPSPDTPRRPAPRLYLVAPPVEHPDDLGLKLDRILGMADIAAVLLKLPHGGERTLIDYAKAVAPAVQDKGVALLLDGHADLVARAGADGAHVTGLDAFMAALDSLKPERIAGAGGVRTRHDAMAAGERGADYVMFGDPDGDRPPLSAILDRIEWWAEVFEVPCIGYAESPDEIAPLAGAGADFVALGAFVLSDPEGAPSLIRAAADTLVAEPTR